MVPGAYRLFAALFAAFAAAAAARAESLALVFDDISSPAQNAVASGARDALKELSVRYGRNFSLENLTGSMASSTPAEQAKALEKAAASGAIGVILAPAKGGDREIAAAVSALAAKKFPTAMVVRDIPDSGRLCFTRSDASSETEAVADQASRRGASRPNFKLLCVVAAKEDRFANKEEAKAALTGAISGEVFERIAAAYDCKFALSELFSQFSKKHAGDISLLDNYGIVFFGSAPLMDLTPLPADGDRAFAMSLEALPHVGRYLHPKQIAYASGQDYYGLGYISAIRLVENAMDGRVPRKPEQAIQPKKYGPEDVEKFNAEWLEFMR